ncbi:MAG: response regulator transcription factor [Comamonadaceae bacterium]|nr:response regulator transcription factor [Comamonadaceae bacterium]
MKVRLLLVDDHQIFREALQRLLLSVTDIEVVGLASSGSEVLELARATAPHVICMDINMTGMNGIEATRVLHAALPGVRVVALSTHSEQRYVLEMLQAGATGYVTKSEGFDELLHAVRAAAQGRTYISSEVTALMADGLLDQHAGRSRKTIGPREWQVLRLVANGHTSNVIAGKLGIAASTVEVHRRNIMRKLDLHSVAELTRYVDSHELPDRRSTNR